MAGCTRVQRPPLLASPRSLRPVWAPLHGCVALRMPPAVAIQASTRPCPHVGWSPWMAPPPPRNQGRNGSSAKMCMGGGCGGSTKGRKGGGGAGMMTPTACFRTPPHTSGQMALGPSGGGIGMAPTNWRRRPTLGQVPPPKVACLAQVRPRRPPLRTGQFRPRPHPGWSGTPEAAVASGGNSTTQTHRLFWGGLVMHSGGVAPLRLRSWGCGSGWTLHGASSATSTRASSARFGLPEAGGPTAGGGRGVWPLPIGTPRPRRAPGSLALGGVRGGGGRAVPLAGSRPWRGRRPQSGRSVSARLAAGPCWAGGRRRRQ